MRIHPRWLWLFASVAGCAPKTIPAPPQSSTSLQPIATANLADLPRAERCSRGDLVVCADLAWAQVESIRPEAKEAGSRELRSLCDRGVAHACARVGDIEWSQNKAAAKAAYERGCSLGSSLACASLGVALDVANPGDARSQELLRKACDAGSPEGCTWLAETMRPKEWTEDMAGTYWALMTRGCSGKFPIACRILGIREQTGNGIPRDAVSAAGHFRVACEGNDAEGCLRWGYAQEYGNGTMVDERGAARAYAIACDDGNQDGCSRLAGAYLHGTGLAKDAVHAGELYRSACKAGHLSSCTTLGRVEAIEPDRTRRLATLSALCSEKVMVACQALGMTLNWTIAEERTTALARLDEACAAKELDACRHGYYAATQPIRKKNGKGIVPMALSFLERSCDMSNPDAGCTELAEALMSGTYVARDAKRGGELAIRLCDAGKPTCRLAGDAFEHGVGAPQDATKAVAAYTKACDISDARACQELARLTRIGKGTKKDPAQADRLMQRAEELADDED
jgi:uncharacterized protein